MKLHQIITSNQKAELLSQNGAYAFLENHFFLKTNCFLFYSPHHLCYCFVFQIPELPAEEGKC